MGAGVGEAAIVAWFYGQLACVRDSKTDLLVAGNAEAEDRAIAICAIQPRPRPL